MGYTQATVQIERIDRLVEELDVYFGFLNWTIVSLKWKCRVGFDTLLWAIVLNILINVCMCGCVCIYTHRSLY